mmetsp:Transcript_2606/g.4057  ORF Transcript_2606/g.4057 Transcript_2606/m.4057 type:complete len:548 (+) Transcript_2606:178-1821(+)
MTMKTIGVPSFSLLAFLMLSISDDTYAFSPLSWSKTPKSWRQDFQSSSRHSPSRSRGGPATSTIVVTATKSPLFYNDNPHSQQSLSLSLPSSWNNHFQPCRRRRHHLLFQNKDHIKTSIQTTLQKVIRRCLTFTMAVIMMWRGTTIPSTANASTMPTTTTTTAAAAAVRTRTGTVQVELLSGGGLGGQSNTKSQKSSSNTITIVTAAAIAGAAGSMMGKQIDVENKSSPTSSSSSMSSSSSSPLRLGKHPIRKKKKIHTTPHHPQGDDENVEPLPEDGPNSKNSDSTTSTTTTTTSSHVVIKMEPSTSKKSFPILSENRMSRTSSQQKIQSGQQPESTIPVIAALERTRAQEQVEKVLERVREAQRRAIVLPLDDEILSPPSSPDSTTTTTTTVEKSPLEEEDDDNESEILVETTEQEQEYSMTNGIVEDTPSDTTIHDFIDVAKKAEATARALLETRLAMEAKEKGISIDTHRSTTSSPTSTSTSKNNRNQSQKAEAFARKLLETRLAMEARSKKHVSHKEASITTTLHQNDGNLEEEAASEETAT